jgi:D-alanine transaminase
MPDLASVNGRISAPHEAVVPIDDRGLMFGDAVYEATRVYGGRVFALDRHLARFRRSLSELAIDNVDADAVGRDITALVERSGLLEALVYWQASRGVHPREHVPPADLTPTVIITVRAWTKPQPPADRGLTVITVPDVRWGRVDIKTTNLLPNTLAKWQAKRAGAAEAILLDGDHVREACSTGVLLVTAGRMLAPEQGPWILPSITRQIVEELAADVGIPVETRAVRVGELLAADEVFLVGSSTEVAGVTAIDGRPVADGRVGPVTRRLIGLYRRYVAETLGLPAGSD